MSEQVAIAPLNDAELAALRKRIADMIEVDRREGTHWIDREIWQRTLATLDAEQQRAEKWSLALQSLTPGGSEYVDDPERCVAFVRETRERQHATILNLKQRLDGRCA